MKRKYEYSKELKRQPQGIQDMINAGAKVDEAKIAAKKAAAKKAVIEKKKEKELWVLKRARKRLKKVFNPKPLPSKSRFGKKKKINKLL